MVHYFLIIILLKIVLRYIHGNVLFIFNKNIDIAYLTNAIFYHMKDRFSIRMKLFCLILPCIIVHFFHLSIQAAPDNLQKYTVVVIPVSGDVDPGMAYFIQRAIQDNIKTPDVLFVLEMDTFGGRVDAALEIVDTMSNLPKGKSIAFVKTKAISAGALIALSCSKLVMRPNTTIGDCAPITYSQQGGVEMLGEKFQSPLRAKFRALAKRNNYPVLLAESMVSTNMTIIRITLPDTVFDVDSIGFQELGPSLKQKIVSKKTLVTPGKLLTMDNGEAHEFGFSSMTANSIEEMLTQLEIKNYTITRIQQTWSEVFVRFIGSIAPILMIIGFACIYWEIKTPGLIFPAVIGIICLAFVFAGQYMVGLANYTELLLIVVGVLLLGLEMFVIPGMGIAGIAGVFFIAIGILLSLQGFVLPKPDMPWQKEILQHNLIMVVGSMIGAVVAITLFFIFIFPKLGLIISGPYLTADLKESHAASSLSDVVVTGETGIVEKPLRPSGVIQVHDRKIDALADGEFLEKGETVVVIEIRGNIVVVTKKQSV